MYLKNLTMLGFKSFADKTGLDFRKGITAIVGPNGCGKSNVADAIRWVLGEQSAKALRGGEMADVIFNGTDARKPVAMAEVSLTISEVDPEQLKAAGVELSYSEVTITRRVYRDGGSDYLINKTPCRLKDIQQLFMGTGVGRTSYSIMAQGNITQIISSKPDDRRMVFEEAAGITRYKSQKKEALRKLEHTEQNLLRVADLIREVKRQIGSLQRQAGKARRYKQIMVELQHLETQWARHQYDQLRFTLAQLEERLTGLRDETETSAQAVTGDEEEVGQLRAALAELDAEVQQVRQRGHEVGSESDRHQSRIHLNEERQRELEAQDAQARREIEDAESRRLEVERELEGIREKLAQCRAAVEEHQRALVARRQRWEAVEGAISREQGHLKKLQTESFSTAQQLSHARNEISSLEIQKQGNQVRLEKLTAEKGQVKEEQVRLEARLREFAADIETGKSNIVVGREAVEDRQRNLSRTREELQRVSEDLDSQLHQQAEKRSRLQVLEQLESAHEGFSEGTLAVLKGTQHVLGSLADRIRVPDPYVVAVETALGHHLQLVLTEHPRAAQTILADLAANGKGRASIAPLSMLGRVVRESAAMVFSENVLEILEVRFAASWRNRADIPPPVGPIPAISIIEAEESVQPLIQGLLGQTVIVPDLETATAAFGESGGTLDYVTLNGDLLTRHGIYTGGSSQPSETAPTSVLGRKNQMADLQAALSGLEARTDELNRKKEALRGDLTDWQASLDQAQSELRSQEVWVASQEGELRVLENTQRTLHQKIQTVTFEMESLRAQEEEGDRKREEASARLSAVESAEAEVQKGIADASAALETLRTERDEAQTSLTETKVALASEEQILSSYEKQDQTLQHRTAELGEIAARRKRDLESYAQRRVQAADEIRESRERLAALEEERGHVDGHLVGLNAKKEELESQIVSREEALRLRRRQLTHLQENRRELEVELAQKNMALDNLNNRIREKYHIELESVRSECITITLADEGPPRVQTLTPEEMEASGVGTDWEAVAEQVAALQKRVDEMGPVNLVAIEEYEETEQRHQFLSSQHDDLVQAKQQLLEVIQRINSQTQEMFVDTFQKIRENFRTLFAEVFGGGKADLVLVDEGDVLESGIDIVARPPGKQLQSISLLSGGEQTMTAVALLFAIYQVKPSPFCVLDELDAPLDESNINRFIRVLQRFLEQSQFVIITHNKRTIGIADVLYGVTMQEHGVSRMVSVRLHKAEQNANGEKGAPLVPPPEADPARARERQDESMEVAFTD